jgi:hypothetical protein
MLPPKTVSESATAYTISNADRMLKDSNEASLYSRQKAKLIDQLVKPCVAELWLVKIWCTHGQLKLPAIFNLQL